MYFTSGEIQANPRFLAGFFNEKFWLIDWRWSVWRSGGRAVVHNLVKVLFSDNDSHVFEWN